MTVPARFRGGTLYDRYAHFRDRIFSSPRFQRWAAGSWMARWIARRRSGALFDLCAGFVYSQILVAAARLELFGALASGPRTTDELVEELAVPARRLRTLLEACAAMRLVEKRGIERWGLGVLGSPLLGNPSVGAMLRHHELLYRDLADPVALLRDPERDTQLGRYWGYARAERPVELGRAEVAPYSALMAETQALLAEDILDAMGRFRAEAWLDVGGGEGTFLRVVGRRRPDMKLRLLDLPAVVARAQAMEGPDLEVFGADMFSASWPPAELVSLVRILHDHDDEAVQGLLAHAFDQLRPGTRLVIAEPMTDAPGHPRVGAPYFGFYLLALGQGRPRSSREIIRMLQGAGFRAVRSISTKRPLLAQLVQARRP
ncbi:MAG: methyltransferase [Myxococcota bacterium]